ncbi:hypothetical protein BKA70DRAFT_1291074 [Coprinopsis sp. MPI-PUGE-AT-0042]|nr:hypothetical protein BKA70DRAFT_1291074 [Coprinopsis sp. MPI-PUGE-AT-0042]
MNFFALCLPLLALCSSALALVVRPPLEARAVPPPPGFNITSIALNGSGCPAGSTSYTLNQNRTGITVSFFGFYAEAGPGIAISQNRKNCRLTFGVGVPPGFTFGISTIDYRGYYQLDNKVTASQNSIYYFQGQTQQATARSAFVGPIDGGDYLFRDTYDLTQTVTAPCGQQSVMNIDADLRVSNSQNPQGSGLISTDSIDTVLITTYHFNWLTC